MQIFYQTVRGSLLIDERKMIYLQVQIISFENRGVEVVKYMKIPL